MKKITLAMVFILLTTLLSACASVGAAAQTTQSSQAPQSPQTSLQPVELTDEQKAEMEAFQAIIGTDPDVQGVVTGVVGNEITLALIEPVSTGFARRGNGDGEAPPEGAVFFTEGTAPEGGATEGAVFFAEGKAPEGGRTPGGNATGGFENMTDEERAALREQMQAQGGARMTIQSADTEVEVKYAGEEITLTIPSALTLRSGMSTVTASGLSKKQVLSLWRDDEETIVYGMVLGKAAAEETP